LNARPARRFRCIDCPSPGQRSTGWNHCRRLRDGKVLSAVWRVAPCRRATGTPSGYALRFLVEPAVMAATGRSPLVEAIAV
jgi:hypothetical protein